MLWVRALAPVAKHAGALDDPSAELDTRLAAFHRLSSMRCNTVDPPAGSEDPLWLVSMLYDS